MNQHNYYIYIMASESGTLYIGVTSDLQKRVYQHKSGTFEGFSKKYRCNKLVYFEHGTNIEDAIRREKFLKGKSRAFKEECIRSTNPGWTDLSKSFDSM